MRFGLSHLRKHKFKHSFQDNLQLRFWCWMTTRYILHYSLYNDKRYTILSIIKNIGYRLLGVTETVLIKTLLFGNCSVDAHTNIHILNADIWWIFILLLIKLFCWFFFPLYNNENIAVLVKDKIISGTSFYFTPKHSENIWFLAIVTFPFYSFVVGIFVIEKNWFFVN